MKKINYLIFIYCIVFSLCISAQEFDVMAFKKAAKKVFLEQRERYKPDNWRYVHSELVDTNHIEFHLPILLIKEPVGDCHNYMFLSPFIERKYSPYNQYAFIKSKEGYLKLIVDEGIYEEKLRICRLWGLYPPPKEDYTLLLKGMTINLGNRDFPDSEKSIEFKRVKEYSDSHPDVILFLIYKIPGIWGYKNNKLIRLHFMRERVEEIDGEAYYRKYLFPLSPRGLKRIIEGEDFRVVITI